MLWCFLPVVVLLRLLPFLGLPSGALLVHINNVFVLQQLEFVDLIASVKYSGNNMRIRMA